LLSLIAYVQAFELADELLQGPSGNQPPPPNLYRAYFPFLDELVGLRAAYAQGLGALLHRE